jgi:serralysin
MNHPGGGAGDNPAFNNYTVDSTIMRYRSARDVYVENKDIITPMQYDIALLQQKYGVNYYDAGDTGAGTTNRITFDPTLNQARTLWEGGASGYDVIDASGALFAKIDLRDGYNADNTPRFSQVEGQVFSLALDPATNWQRVVTIEEVIGTVGKDTIYGNDADNVLTGGGGTGDSIEGGKGFDTYLFDGSFGANEWVTDSDGQGKIVIDGEDITGSAQMVNASSEHNITMCWWGMTTTLLNPCMLAPELKI